MSPAQPKVVLVTGAGSGVGRAVALAHLRQGDRVVLTGRRIEQLAETAALAPERSEILVHPCDITDSAAVEALFAATEARFGRLDLLFNNAGRSAPAVPVDELPLETWHEVVAVNLTGAFLCARAAVALMRRQRPAGGRIINNGSISAHVPRPLSTAYTATKHAITGLTRSLALDGRDWGVACGQIDIGNAGTPMTVRMSRGALQADGSLAPEPTIDVELVADAVVMMGNLPLEANMPFVTVMATRMPFFGRG